MECDVDGIRVYYEIDGEGRPVVMLHGWGSDHTEMTMSMEPQFAGRDGWKRVYLDLPGSGNTPGADWIESNDQMLDVVERFIDRVIPGERFLVVGQSYGGYLARGLVYRRMGDIDGILMTVPAIAPRSGPSELPPRTVVFRDPALEAQARAENLIGFLNVVVTQNASALERSRKFGRNRRDQQFLDRLGKRFQFSIDVDALPQPCPAPTLFVLGRQDHMCGYRDAWRIIENYPRSTFAVLDGAGHGLIGEKAHLFRPLVQDWLDRVEQWEQTRASDDRAASPSPTQS